MKFYVTINLDEIQLVSHDYNARHEFEKENNNDDLLLTDPSERHNSGVMKLCTREFGNLRLSNYNHAEKTGELEYDDFFVGSTPDDRPEWFPALKDRIVATVAEGEYGLEQGLYVSESVTYGKAEARIRCEPSEVPYAGCVLKVKISAKGGPSTFGDALKLHAQILAGN